MTERHDNDPLDRDMYPSGRPRRSSRPYIPIHDPVTASLALCKRLGHFFAQPSLLAAALTHPSWRNEYNPGGDDNQRLEFLGDSVLGMVITHELVRRLPDRGEGELTVLKSQLVRATTLAALAEELTIGHAIRIGRGEDLSGGRARPSILADAMEAVLGAVFLDGGYKRVHEVILDLFEPLIREVVAQVEAIADAPTALSASTANWKTALQELLQHIGAQLPDYQVVGEDGPDHERRFEVSVTTRYGDQVLEATGTGATKKSAEHEAAAGLYRLLADLTGVGGAAPEAHPDPDAPSGLGVASEDGVSS